MKPNLTFVIDEKLLNLCKHAIESKSWTKAYGEEGAAGPALILVKDEGIYLLSNGQPRLFEESDPTRHIAYSVEANPLTNKDSLDVYEAARKIMGGDDSAEYLAGFPQQVLEAHAAGLDRIEFEVSPTDFNISFTKAKEASAKRRTRRP